MGSSIPFGVGIAESNRPGGSKLNRPATILWKGVRGLVGQELDQALMSMTKYQTPPEYSLSERGSQYPHLTLFSPFNHKLKIFDFSVLLYAF